MENKTDTEMPQVPESVDDNNLLANMFNSFLSQAGQNESKVAQDNDNDNEEEEEEDSDDEDSDDEDSDKWVALQKLLDSHLLITKCLLRMIKEK